jgi:hypothetical protein
VILQGVTHVILPDMRGCIEISELLIDDLRRDQLEAVGWHIRDEVTGLPFFCRAMSVMGEAT